MSKRKILIFFAIIVLVNIIVKSLHASYASFSYDEIISIKNTQLEFGHIKHEAEWDNNPPFYYYCLWLWHSLVPINEFTSRLLSVLFVSVSIGLSFIFANRYFTFQTAIFSAILLSLSNFLTYYSLEARTYSLVILLVLVSTILFFSYLSEGRLMKLILLSLVNFLIFYSHYVAALVIIFQIATVLLIHKKKFVTFFCANAIIIIGLVLLRFTNKQYAHILNFNKDDNFWLKRASFDDLQNVLDQLFFGHFVAICFFALLLVAAFIGRKEFRKDDLGIYLYCYMSGFISIFLLFLIGMFKPLFLDRYLIFSVPFATIIVCQVFEKFEFSGRVILSFLVGLVLLSWHPRKESTMDYRSLVKIIKPLKKESDFVIINTRDNILLFLYYFNRNDFMTYRNADSLLKTKNIFGLNEESGLKDINVNANSTIFLVQSFHNLHQEENSFDKYLSAHYTKVYSYPSLRGVELNVFKN